MRFTHETLPQQVVFASGEAPAAVAEEARRLGACRFKATNAWGQTAGNPTPVTEENRTATHALEGSTAL